MNYEDILYEKRDGVARITINRPSVYNAFRAQTCEEIIAAMKDADHDRSVGVVVITGASTLCSSVRRVRAISKK